MNIYKGLDFAGFWIMAVIILLAGNIKFYTDANDYKKQAETVRLRQDSLLAVNQLLEKENFDLQKKNNALTNRIISLIDLLPQKEKEKVDLEMHKKAAK